VVSARLAVVAESALAALHGAEGRFTWGEARTFEPGDGLAAWEPHTVIALGAPPPAGPWRTIAWVADDTPPDGGDRTVGAGADHWRRAPLPAADSLAALRSRRGAGVVVAGGNEAARAAALERLAARGVDGWGAASTRVEDVERAAVVALVGTPGDPLAGAATAVLAAGRVLVAPRADPGFGLLPWSDYLPYDNEDELACAADAAQTFPEAFEVVTAMGILAAEAHLASAVYGRLAADAELEDRAASASA
jgi:hypothetical protein